MTNTSKGLLTIIFTTLLSFTFGARILVIHPLYSGSHVLTWRGVSEYLTQRGHEVHIVRWKDDHVHPSSYNANITETVLSMSNPEGRWNLLTNDKKAAFKVPYEILWNGGMSFKTCAESGFEAFPLMYRHCDRLLSNQALIRKLDFLKFDLAIVDLIMNECSLALVHHLGIPVVGYWGLPFASGETDYTTAFLPPSTTPNFLSKLTNKMSFPERFFNLLISIASHGAMEVQCLIINHSVQKNLPGTPNPCSLIGELNGMLINTDHTMDYPQLLPPTFIKVGGLHIREPRPLSQDLQEWMQNSEHGVVLFSLGYIFNPKVLPKTLVAAFMHAFSRLPQRFLVKLEGPIDYVPPNVKVLSWIPQQSILAHEKTRLFITHCGLHGVMESIYNGVPMLGMPIFIDQGDALVKMEEKGIALGIDKDSVTSEEIYEKLHRILYEPHFRQNALKQSILMRDVKEPPLERALDLIDYLIRHNGADHLKLPSRHLNFIQYFSLDTIALLSFIVVVVMYLQFCLCRYLYKSLSVRERVGSLLFSFVSLFVMFVMFVIDSLSLGKEKEL